MTRDPIRSAAFTLSAFLIAGATTGQVAVADPLKLDDATRVRCVQVLREGLHSNEFWPAIHAAEGLTIGGHGNEVIDYLEPKVETEKDDQRRCGLARELVRAGRGFHRNTMLQILAGDDPHGHIHAAESLYKVAGTGDGKSMRASVDPLRNRKLQLMAAAALARGGDLKAFAIIRESLHDEDDENSRIGAWILARIGDRSDIPRLKKALPKITTPIARTYFDHALAALGDKAGQQALLNNLDSDDAAIRTYAATFAGDARMLTAGRKLVRQLNDEALDARIRAAQSLLDLSRPEQAGRFVLRRHGVDGEMARSAAVRVGNAHLVHTTQLFPVSPSGRADSTRAQFLSVRQQLDLLLTGFRSTRGDVVKLNVYLRNADVRRIVQEEISRLFHESILPAVSYVETPLPNPDAQVAIDAVFAARDGVIPGRPTLHHDHFLVGDNRKAHASVLPRGDVVYVSGQADAGNLGEATRDTMASLVRTLQELKLDRDNIVEIKCFLTPMTSSRIVDEQLAAFFKDKLIPPVSYVEWIAGSSRPIEIELVAWAPPQESASSVTFSTPSWMKSSPVFSRVARIHGNDRIYVSGLFSDQKGGGERQVRLIFRQFNGTASAAGSDLKHLAKATYYVSESDASSKLNELRPQFYDPKRPPAASKAMVKGVGHPGRGISIDMIAAPVKSTLPRPVGQ